MTKTRIFLLIFFTLYLAVIVKLFFIQILNPRGSDTAYLTTRKIYPERGTIFDRNGLPLVVNKTSFLLYAEPKKIPDHEYFINKIDSVLHIGESTLEAKLDKTKDWVSLKTNLSEDIKEKILDLKLPGVGFTDGFQRYYPESSLSAHLLGFVGKNTRGEDLGYFGIEGYYNKDLVGLPGILKSDRDLLGKPILMGTQQKLNPENGRDLYLTIDKSIQEIAKSKLREGLEIYDAKEGCIIIANPQTLEVLALVCLPDFDQERYFTFSEEFFKDPAISNLYEPGSTFKPLIMAAALEEKSIKADDFYNEKGPVKIGEYTIKTWNDKYEGRISMSRIIEKSSNVGMVHIGQKLGNIKLYTYLKKFGFDQITGIDLQGEGTDQLRPRSNWYPIDYATVSFGQGIAITPVQMVMAFSSLINGGKLLKPYIVQQINSPGEEKFIKSEMLGTPISEKTSDYIKKMLLSAVENGELKWAKPKGYKIGGKTGTAQIPIKGHYDPSKTVASFIGFAPVDNPKFLALVILREPQSSPWGSETAAPLFFEVANELLVYYNIAPE